MAQMHRSNVSADERAVDAARQQIRFDPTSIDLTDLDLVEAARAARAASGSVANRAIDLAREVTYVSVGLGLLSFQRAQVRRREFERSLRR